MTDIPDSIPMPTEAIGRWREWRVSPEGDLSIWEVTGYSDGSNDGSGFGSTMVLVVKIPGQALHLALSNAREGRGAAHSGRVED